MKCPVCKRELAPTLSICFTCGAMVNDSVREELETKIERISGPLGRRPVMTHIPWPRSAETSEHTEANLTRAEVGQKKAEPIEHKEPAVERPVRVETREFANKKTSPTLIGFQPKNATVPDWRLQLQNSVRQRKSDGPAAVGTAPAVIVQKQTVTNGANALKAKYVEAPEVADHENPRVANALKRIEASRQRFAGGSVTEAPPEPAKPSAARNFPFNVVSRTEGAPVAVGVVAATVNAPPKPKLVSAMRIEKKAYDTNKLPLLPQTEPDFEDIEIPTPPVPLPVQESINVVVAEYKEEFPVVEEIIEMEDNEAFDDLAPISSRFIAGFFDLIVGGFITSIVLSPLLVSGGQWLSVAGVLAITAAFGLVMFVYLTLAAGLRGRTLGMKLFSLEIVDAEENEFPTLHQAAVNSAVFLVALPLLGIGFIPVFFNEERRAIHDLISGTVLVKEI